MHYLKKLKTLLQSNYIYYFLLLFSIIMTLIVINSNINSVYDENVNTIEGYVKDYKISSDKLIIYIKDKEDLVVYSDKILNISYGDIIKVNGYLKKPSNNTNFNLFNYKKYLLSRKIKYIVYSDDIKVVKKTNNIFFILKNKILNQINKCSKSKSYIKTFIFADKNDIDMDKFQKLGISHLMAISGMHVSLICFFLLKLLSFLKERKRNIIICIILIIYMFLTNFTVSMMRAGFQFILFFINKTFKLNIKNTNIVILLFSLFLIYNPFYIYNIGFIFSFSISYSLIRFQKNITKGNLIHKLFKISIISFLISIPILSNNYYQINILGIIYNIFYVPFVSYILFPFSLLTFLFPFLDNINYLLESFFENISIYLSNIEFLVIKVAKIPVILIVIYYIVLYTLFDRVNIKKIILIIMLIIVFIFNKSYLIYPNITYIDVKQGDCTLIRIKNKNILIDTGGLINSDYNIIDNILLPSFNSHGVKKINYLVLTHGDYDHMGEAINLVNNFKVEKVIFNCGPYNDLEKELIKVLDKKKIKYYSCINELKIDNNKLYFLQTKEYDNENDNSNVIYTELNGYKFMFMGDAGIEKEKDILDKYNVSTVDVLKVGHHGSKTSSGKDFIDEINPKYSIVSVGKNNRYGHPNKEVLNVLVNSKIYRTDQDGSIMFMIKNNKIRIKTCAP